MAIKRLRVNDDGEFEERKLAKSELPPPPPKPAKRAPAKKKALKIGAASPPRAGVKGTAKGGGGTSSRVKVTQRASKKFAAGKNVLDHDMVRFECPKCGMSRVGNEETKALKCPLCMVAMKRNS